MNSIIIATTIVLTITGVIAWYLIYTKTRHRQDARQTGVPGTASGTQSSGDVWRSSEVNLIGRPAEVMVHNGVAIPVAVIDSPMSEDKTEGYTMQLMAYCLLVEEKYGTRPPGGILRYADRELKIAYTDEARTAVIDLVREMEKSKVSNSEYFCDHPEHNL
jgi:CRISPR/Cas system-associated exonuclease Cas4 (RecB family)